MTQSKETNDPETIVGEAWFPIMMSDLSNTEIAAELVRINEIYKRLQKASKIFFEELQRRTRK